MAGSAKYGAIICPKCHYPRGVQLASKQGECYHCGYTFKIPKLKIFFETDSETALSEAVGRLNAKMHGGLEEYLRFLEEYENVPVGYEHLEPHKRIAAKLRHVTDPYLRLQHLARELSLELNEFEKQDVYMVLEELSIRGKRADEMFKALIENNFIFEPRPNVYRLVND